MDKNKFDLQKRIEAEGFKAIDVPEERALRAIQARVGEYHTYFDALTKLFANSQRNSSGQMLAAQALQASTSLVKQIDVLLTLSDVKKASEASKNVLEQLQRIEEAFAYLTSQETLPQTFKDQIAEAEGSTGLTVKEMQSSVVVMQSRYQKMGKAKKPTSLGGKLLQSDLAKGIAYTMLGPFGSILKMGVDWQQKRQEKQKALGEQAFAEATLTREQKTPEGFAKMSKFLAGSDKYKIEEDVVRGQEGKYTSVGTVASKTASGGMSGGGASSKKTLMEGMIAFFSGPAFSTPWTKKLLAAVEGEIGIGKGKDKDKKKEEQSDFLSGLIKGLVTAPLVASIGMMVWDAFKAQSIAKKEGWLRKSGEELQGGQKIAVGLGGTLGGTGPGVFDKGSLGDKAKNVGWGAAKGGLLGAGIGMLPGALGLLASLALAPLTAGASLAGVPLALSAMGAGALKGGLIGAGVGAGTHAIGGKKISQGVQATTRLMSGQDIQTGEFKGSAFPSPKTGIKFSEQELLPKFVPIDISNINIEQKSQEGLDKLSSIMTEVKEEIQKSSKGKPQSFNSGYDAYNTRDPIILALNSGMVDIAST